MKFLISGGGICGLTTAFALQQQGYEVAVYEAVPTIKSVGAGISLSTNAIRALEAIGLAEVVMNHAKTQKDARFLTAKGKVLNYIDFSPIVEKFGFPGIISIHRAELHQLLLEQLKGQVQFYTNKRSKRITQNKDGVQLYFTDGTSVQGDYLLACDGIHSPIRQQLLPESRLRYAGYTIWRGLMTDLKGEIDVPMPFKSWGRRGQFGGAPMPNHQIYWFASINAPQNDPTCKAMTIADLQQRFGQFHDPIPKILERSKAEDLLWNDAIELEPIEQFAFGKVLLMGDAAHAMTPNLGQGACQAIEDSAVLAQLLKKETSITQAFQTFEQLRIPRTKRATMDSSNLGKVAHLQNPILVALRNFAFGLTAKRNLQRQIDFLSGVEF